MEWNEMEPSYGMEPHTCSSHQTPQTEMDLCDHPRLSSEFLFGNLFIYLPPLPPSPSGGQES